jgi:hypothetical protein
MSSNLIDCDLYPWCDSQGCVGHPETCHRAADLRAGIDKRNPFSKGSRTFGHLGTKQELLRRLQELQRGYQEAAAPIIQQLADIVALEPPPPTIPRDQISPEILKIIKRQENDQT